MSAKAERLVVEWGPILAGVRLKQVVPEADVKVSCSGKSKGSRNALRLFSNSGIGVKPSDPLEQD